MTVRYSALVACAVAMIACVQAIPAAQPPTASAAPIGIETCIPSDQDRYVYRPARLRVVAPCLRVTGTIVASTAEADGDYHINVRVDPPFATLLNDANAEESGYLIVEPVCLFPPLQAEAIRVCASDPNPLTGGLPQVGEHVWLEGRYVLDLQHHGWAELHPLYRWGRLAP